MCGRIAVKILCGIRLTVFIKDLLPAEEDGKTAASLNRNGHISYELEIGKKLTFVIKPTGFKHTGLFPEQASNWEWFTKLIHKRTETGKNVKVLNLFAYTGAATAAAAAAGASVCHVDASRGMVMQAKENARLSGLEASPIRYLVDDCKKFVEREIRRGNRVRCRDYGSAVIWQGTVRRSVETRG